MSGSGRAPDLLGQSESLLAVKERLSQAARVDRPVLILGERGTGKELAAARLHFLSQRWQGPYLTLNCAALAPGLLDAELFGHEAGAFTGAARRRQGRFEAADTGSLFLDEISHLTMEAQARILRVVEYGAFQLVGSSVERKVDVRVIAATNANLLGMCQNGTFLPDLWDRLSFEVITLPPLRDRPGDISTLAHYFAARMAQEMGLPATPLFAPETLQALEAHSWPGNVRELKNMVERLVYRASASGTETIAPDSAHQALAGAYSPSAPEAPGSPRQASSPALPNKPNVPNSPSIMPALPLGPGQFDEFLRLQAASLIDQAMAMANHNQIQAAKLLGLSYSRFRFLRRKFAPDK
jgi:psp operon transcriptional activator